MFKSHTPFRMILLSACLLPATSAMADVLSSTTTSDLIEPANTYDTSYPSLLNMRVRTVIGSGDCGPGVNDGCTLNDVLNDIDGSDDFEPEIKVHMTADDFPDDGLVSNAELRQRGATSRGAPQKSFRVKLDSSDALWRGERRIQLVKSFWDFSRIRNKLSYDLFIDIPNLPSMRTQFVNFSIEDQGSVDDYGLYTHVEYFGKEYLVRRGWDDDSGVYKAENFYFKDDPGFALGAEGEPIDEAAFEKLMEIKRGDDHREFVNMIQAVNNPSLDFESQVFNKYFNKDNYLTWFAINLLTDNYDTNFHNFYLYNPKGTEKFYFVPWDYDLALGSLFDTNYTTRTDLPRWTQSHANWWGQELHQQFLKQPGNLDLLKEAVLEVKNKYLTRAKLQQKADSYYNFVFPMISASPDIDKLYLGGTNPEKIAAYNNIFSSLADKVEQNYNQFIEHIADPMPFLLYDPVANGDQSYSFSWSVSESLYNQSISYDIQISTTVGFDTDSIVFSQSGIQGTNVTVPWNYAAGNYFYRIIARDSNEPSRYWQVGYNQVDRGDGTQDYGIVAFNATIDGSSAYPQGNPDFASTTQDSAITIDVLANDTGTGLVLSSTNDWSESGGSVTISNNKINYQPKSGFTGNDRLWYVFRDSQGRRNFGVVNITVSGSAYPVGNPDTVSTALNSPLTIDVLANDIGSGLSLTSSNPWSLKGGRVAISNNRISYTPKQDFSGEDKLWYVFQDSSGRVNSSSVTINVTGTSAYPVAYTDSVSVAAGSSVTFNAMGNDTGTGLWVSEVNAYSVNGGTISNANNQLTYTPRAGYKGTDSFWYVITDIIGRTNSAKVTVSVY